ncbi:MAG: glycine betaine ABC transporter substrate-binding protein [Candidatus Krumholzibacteriia bacterium]
MWSAVPGVAAADERRPVRVASKKFTESVILGEMLALLARDAGAAAVHRPELGGTRVLWNALRRGDIDAYPEYTGTIAEEILGGALPPGASAGDLDALRTALAPHGVVIGPPLGFENTYALGMRADRAQEHGIGTISALRDRSDLRVGFTSEFLDRRDGWPALRDAYDLHGLAVRGLDHDLAYRALLAGDLDVTDFYSTDAEIAEHGLTVLADDREHFPEYRAVVLYRAELVRTHPEVTNAFASLAGRLSAVEMAALNARAKVAGEPAAVVAAGFLTAELGLDAGLVVAGPDWKDRLLRHTLEHLALVGVSLTAAVLVAVPLGVVAARRRRLGQVVLTVAGILQTIPALALLVLMIPLLGIGAVPAVTALFLYSLLPVLRNTHAGLTGIPLEIRESAEALGLPRRVQLLKIELPLASRAILAGIKTSAVINVGTATLGALIGAGGYGQPILTGIRLDSVPLILLGAVPAALLALALQGLFELAERRLVPRGLRLQPQTV